MKYKRSLFVFRRDYRLDDNTGLIQACENSEQVIPCFLFEKNLINQKNPVFGKMRIRFMVDSLKDLFEQAKAKKCDVLIKNGTPSSLISSSVKNDEISAVFMNRDNSPYGRFRDNQFKKTCEKNNIAFETYGDLLLRDAGSVLKQDDTPFLVFTPFYKTASQFKVREPQAFSYKNLANSSQESDDTISKLEKIIPETSSIKGGRKNGLKILKNFDKIADYNVQRNIPSKPTSQISAHNRFGTISIREVHKAASDFFGSDHSFISELYWRDFFTHLMFHFPYSQKKEFQEKYQDLKWSHDKKKFEKWANGMTGFPIVDAGMRELKQTGFMHNRCRMIVASFLTKDLQIDWRLGERHFAKYLIDYDPCVNAGSWQWSASTGCDAQPYFRVFNPWLQQKKFDPECVYIKKWIPELSELSTKQIHDIESKPLDSSVDYPEPMVFHKEESARSKLMFKVA
ncbi:MAG: deoxyribodipyrimidine photolyase [Candidatus Nitrosopelagicus sp.]|nr:deoxyribodipyrimidine photolyase [Candidatus Nitrosopelagicus sp.]